MKIHCCGCKENVNARLTNGKKVYPHRGDLHSLPFWIRNKCNNFVGCHHKTKNRTNPLGCIPTPELKNARQHIHKILDPIWQSEKMKRRDLYQAITDRIGLSYHTAKLKTVEEAREVYRILREYA